MVIPVYMYMHVKNNVQVFHKYHEYMIYQPGNRVFTFWIKFDGLSASDLGPGLEEFSTCVAKGDVPSLSFPLYFLFRDVAGSSVTISNRPVSALNRRDGEIGTKFSMSASSPVVRHIAFINKISMEQHNVTPKNVSRYTFHQHGITCIVYPSMKQSMGSRKYGQ